MRRHRRHNLLVTAMAAALALCLAFCALGPAAQAAIRVAEDEVYFSLRAPGANVVFLVGDFNNWNATVEKMEKTGDVFEISLYMIEGSYRYKFVVDGQWIVDPDNPGDPSRGSPLVLVEKPAGLMLLTEDPEEEKASPALSPWFRYIGQFRWNRPDDMDFRDAHVADLGLVVNRERLRGNAVLEVSNDAWVWADPADDVVMNRGSVGTDVGPLSVDAFENDDVVWTSIDPATLVGKLGVFDYNAGYDRGGVSADYKFGDPVHLRGFYADHTGPLPSDASAISTSDLLAASSGADTVAYEFGRGVGDSDVLGLEFYLEVKGYQGGVVSRYNRGMRPGTMADVAVADSAAVVYDTRENQDATIYWLRLKKIFGVGLGLAYGRGHSDIQQLTSETQRVDPSRDLEATQLSQPVDHTVEFAKSDRFIVGLDYGRDNVESKLDWDRVTWEFDGPVYGGSEATVDRVTFDFELQSPRAWRVGCRLQYTHQDYGDTPATLLVDSPVRNMWLDWRDNFTVPNIVGIDTDAFTDLAVSLEWYPGREAKGDDGGDDGESGEGAELLLYPGLTEPIWSPPAVRLEVGTTADEFFRALEYNRARLTLTYKFMRYFFAVADGRVATYDKPTWGPRETFASGYVEAGYRRRWFEVNLGWGFDPVIFDPVVNGYNDIGRLRLLRTSLADGVTRDRSVEIGEELLSRERFLQGVQTIKLEVILRF